VCVHVHAYWIEFFPTESINLESRTYIKIHNSLQHIPTKEIILKDGFHMTLI
jgi:hypothetical protein